MLKFYLTLNAMSCLVFGCVLLAFAPKVAIFLGGFPVWLLRLLGAGLIVNGTHLAWVAREIRPRHAEVLYFIAGDVFWVAGTAICLAIGGIITTPQGQWTVLGVAVFVAICAAGQVKYLPRPRAEKSDCPFTSA
jgi:hypothetical protein